ncbi:MAG TPA: sugar ABC transporter permease [Thermomicrobiales bacterium]|nr:sugar ABC transporter permease [Thermomicrobiales bacterium]
MHKLRRHLPAYLMVAPTVLLFIVFLAFPLMSVLFTSLLDWNGIVGVRDARWIGLDNYRRLVDDATWWRAVRNSALFTLTQLVVETPLALALALLLNSPRRAAAVVRTIGFLPAVASTAVVALAFSLFFSPLGGPANTLLVEKVGLLDRPLAFLGERGYAFWTVTGVAVWQNLGLDVVLFLAALQAVDRDLLDAAAVDGANAWRRLWAVTLPAIRPVAAVIVLLTLAFSLQVYDIFAVMTGGGPGNSSITMSLYMVRYTTLGAGAAAVTVPAVGYGSAIAVAMGTIIAVAVLFWQQVVRRERGRA